MSIFYTTDVMSSIATGNVYSYYKGDLKSVYPVGIIFRLERLDTRSRYWFLPYILVNENGKFVKIIDPFICQKENWKENYVKSHPEDKSLHIIPVSIEDYEYKYSQTVYYVYYRLPSGLHTKVWSKYKTDLKAVFFKNTIYKAL